MQILIAIQTFNGLELTKNTIKSIREQDTTYNISLFVIDNWSTDGTLDFLKQNNIHHKILIPRECSAKGMNVCLDYYYNNPNFDYLILLNNDVYIYKNFVQTLVSDFEEQNKIRPGGLLMCGTQTTKNNPKQRSAILNKELQDMEDQGMTGDFSAFIISRETIDKIGYFDEIYTPRYVEDNDYLHRIYISEGYAIRNGKCLFDHETGAIFKIQNESNFPSDFPPESAHSIMVRNSIKFRKKWGVYPKGLATTTLIPAILSENKNLILIGGALYLIYKKEYKKKM